MKKSESNKDTLANTQDELAIEKDIAIDEPTPSEDTLEEKQKSSGKRKIVLFSILGVVLALLAALVIIAEPWVKADELLPEDIIPEQMALVSLAVGDTKQIELELGDNETIVSFASNCPEALSVDASGVVTATAEADVVVTATIRETEVVAPELTGIQRIRSRLRILLGIEDAIDYDTLEPRVVRIIEYPFKVTGVPTEDIDFLFELYVDGTAEFAEIELEDGEAFRVACEDESIAIMESETMVKAIAPGETSIIFTYGIEAEVDGELAFLPTHSKILPLKVNAIPANGNSSSYNKPINVSGSMTGGDGLSGGGSAGSAGSGSGSGSGSGGSGSTGGGSTGGTTRTYPLPSESEVSSFVGQALGYANGLGMGTNTALNTGNAGYGSPACTWELPWSDVKGEVYWQIDWLYDYLASYGWQPDGAPCMNISYTFSGGEYYIYVMWG